MKYAITTVLITGVFLSFHDTYWPWAIIPAGIVWGTIALGLTLERKGL
jgi:hypothetical protein